MSKRYHTLLSRHAGWLEDDKWHIEFGDYDRETVKGEMLSYRYQGVYARDLKIITTSDRQADIEAAVAALNGEG